VQDVGVEAEGIEKRGIHEPILPSGPSCDRGRHGQGKTGGGIR
jgi:hypothetical protein